MVGAPCGFATSMFQYGLPLGLGARLKVSVSPTHVSEVSPIRSNCLRPVVSGMSGVSTGPSHSGVMPTNTSLFPNLVCTVLHSVTVTTAESPAFSSVNF